MKKNVLIIFPLLIVSLLAAISFGYIPANKFNVNSADNLLFHLDSYNFFLFPFQQLVHSFIAHEDFFSMCLRYFIYYSPIILLFCCSYLAYGVGASIIAALIAAILYICEAIDIEQALIAFSLMLVISAYLIKFKTEQRRNVYLAFALFAAMWSKGVCFPFVLGIIIYEFFIAQKFSAKVLSKKWLILVLFLIANISWTTINYLESPKNKLIFFTEYSGRSASNIITGALGYTQTVEGNIFEALGIDKNINVHLWAVKQIVSHPVRYIISVFSRLKFLFFNQYISPFLFLIFLVFIAALLDDVKKKRRDKTVLLIAIIYYFTLHILMPVEQRYFVPSFILMILYAAPYIWELIERKNKYAVGLRKYSLLINEELQKNINLYFSLTSFILFAVLLISFLLFITLPLRKNGKFNAVNIPHDMLADNKYWAQYVFKYKMLGGDFVSANFLFNKLPVNVKTHWLKGFLVLLNGRNINNFGDFDYTYDYRAMLVNSFFYFAKGDLQKGKEYFENSTVLCINSIMCAVRRIQIKLV